MVYGYFHCDCFFYDVCASKVVCAYVCIYFFAASILNMLGAFLKVVTWLNLLVIDLVFYLFVLILSTLMTLYVLFSTSGITWGCGSVVSAFIFPILIFGIFLFLGVTATFLLSWKIIGFLLDALVGIPLGISPR